MTDAAARPNTPSSPEFANPRSRASLVNCPRRTQVTQLKAGLFYMNIH